MFNWLRRIKSKDEEARALLEQSHKSNVAIIQKAKNRSERVSKQADKTIKRVYDITEKIFIATGQGR